MDPTTETPVHEAPPAEEHAHAPLPASDRDLRWRRIRSRDPRFRVALIIGAIVLLVVSVALFHKLRIHG